MSTQAAYINHYLWSLKGGGRGEGGGGRGEGGEGNNLAAYIGPAHLEHSKKKIQYEILATFSFAPRQTSFVNFFSNFLAMQILEEKKISFSS